MVDLSLIIISWNARQYLLDCLDSIMASPGRHAFEIIVVDNASADGSPQAVAERHPGVRLIRLAENTGFAHANNVGMQAAQGRYYFLINSDVLLHGDCLERLAGLLDINPKIGLCGPRVLNGDGSLQPSCRHLPGYWNVLCRALALDKVFPRSAVLSGPVMAYWPHDRRRDVQALSGCFLAARRDAVDQVGPLDEGFFFYAEDVDWCARFGKAGWRIVFEPAAVITHFGGKSSANAPARFAIEKQKADLRHWRKHHGRPGVAWFKFTQAIALSLRIIARCALLATQPSRRPHHRGKLDHHLHCLMALAGQSTSTVQPPSNPAGRKQPSHV